MPCNISYFEDVRKVDNTKHKTPFLNYQHTGNWLEDNFTLDVSMKDFEACPACWHKSTMALGSHVKANCSNKEPCTNTLVDGGTGNLTAS